MRRNSRFAIGVTIVVLALGAPVAWLLAADKADADKKTPVAEKKKADDEKKNPVAEKKDDSQQQLLETVGTLAGTQLYQSYLNIGFIADGKAERTYTDKDVEKILDSILALLDTLDDRLRKVAKLEVSKDDRETIDQVRLLSALLRQEGDELKAFWKTGGKEHSDKYEKARKEAWEGISKLLKLDK